MYLLHILLHLILLLFFFLTFYTIFVCLFEQINCQSSIASTNNKYSSVLIIIRKYLRMFPIFVLKKIRKIVIANCFSNDIQMDVKR